MSNVWDHIETKRTDITGALERTLDNLNVLTALRPDKWAALQADAALLRSLAARITDYNKALAVAAPYGPTFKGLQREVRAARSALLAFIRGETPNNPKQQDGTDNG